MLCMCWMMDALVFIVASYVSAIWLFVVCRFVAGVCFVCVLQVDLLVFGCGYSYWCVLCCLLVLGTLATIGFGFVSCCAGGL